MKRHPLRRTGALALATLTCLAALSACGKGGSGVRAGEVEAEGQALQTAAEEEGKVIFYCSLTPDSCKALGEGFEKKYSGISVEVLRATSPDLSARYSAEKRSGADTADVILHADIPFIQKALEDGLITSFEDAGFLPDNYPEEWILNSNDISGTPYLFEALGVGINTELVKPADYPKAWADLGDPKWKGKMNGPGKNNAGYATIYGTLDDGTDGLLEALSKQKIFPDSGGMVSLTESLAAGEYALQTVASKAAVESAKAKGAPVTIVFPEPGATGPAFSFTLNPEPGHPNAQKLFASYVLSEDANQRLFKTSSAIAAPYTKPAFPLLHPNVDYHQPEKAKKVAEILAGDR